MPDSSTCPFTPSVDLSFFPPTLPFPPISQGGQGGGGGERFYGMGTTPGGEGYRGDGK
jgi:hypothetical protein